MSSAVGSDPYPHWMLREIYEQPSKLAATLSRYLVPEGDWADTCSDVERWISSIKTKLLIAASGSSRHAALLAEQIIEDISGIPVDVEYASEYCCRSENSLANAAVMVISQSGETADTLAALRKANQAGHSTLAITNVDHSSMDREATVTFPTVANLERAIPATKSFTAQLLNLYLFAIMAAVSRKTLDAAEVKIRLQELNMLPGEIESQFKGWNDVMRDIAYQYGAAKNFLFLGRGIHYPIAREGALKLKESAYLHAEGYPSGELKHGPNALVSKDTPLVMIATVDHKDADSVQRYGKIVRLMRDMREQGANILAIANQGDMEIANLATDTIYVKEMREVLMAICEVIPLQLLSYWIAISRGINVDNPRNLTKAVLSE